MAATLCEPSSAPAHPAAGDLTVKLITGKKLPADLAEQARRLDVPGPFGRTIWWATWWQYMRRRGSELFLLLVMQGDQLVGLAPWYTERTFGFGRIVRFLGDGCACSDYATVAALPAYRASVWREITRWVVDEAGRSWDAFMLAGVSAADEHFQTFCQQLKQHGVLVDQRTTANTWRLNLPETWDDYLATLSKQHRNRVRRMKRDMLDSGRATFHRATSLADVARGFEIQHHLHQLRRNSLGDAGRFANPPFERFLREAMQSFQVEGALRLQWTEVDGEPVAFDSGFVDQNSVFVYQTGFDPAKSELSPGRLHFQQSIMTAIQQGYASFDFLRGDEPYKAHFRATPIPVLETRLIGPRVLSRLRHRAWGLQKGLKARIRTARTNCTAPSPAEDREHV